MASKSIPISETTLARLQELARWSNVSLDEALNRAIKDQYDRQFWDATNAAYAALRADPVAWAEIEEERHLLGL
jgi:predicted transcriptional regulator